MVRVEAMGDIATETVVEDTNNMVEVHSQRLIQIDDEK
jgi:hypothetical protein